MGGGRIWFSVGTFCLGCRDYDLSPADEEAKGPLVSGHTAGLQPAGTQTWAIASEASECAWREGVPGPPCGKMGLG